LKYYANPSVFIQTEVTMGERPDKFPGSSNFSYRYHIRSCITTFFEILWINTNHGGARARNEGFGRQDEKVALFCFGGLDAQNHSVGFDQAAGASCAG
jgi:hypothetical protein